MRFSTFFALFAVACISLVHGDNASQTIAGQLSQITHKADSVTVVYLSDLKEAEFTFVDKEWILRLAAILEKTTYEKQEHCFCITYPNISLNAKDDVICRLSVHHGEKLRANGGIVSGDFFIGEEAGSAIVKLIQEKKRAN